MLMRVLPTLIVPSRRTRSFHSHRYHVQEHWGSQHAPKQHECVRCGKAFGVDSQRLRHESRCGILLRCACGKAFASSEGRAKHMKKNGHVPAVGTQPERDTFPESRSGTAKWTRASVKTGVGGKHVDKGAPSSSVRHLQQQPRHQVEAGAQTLMVGEEFEAGMSLISLAPLPSLALMSSSESATDASRHKTAAACQTPFEWVDDAIGSSLPPLDDVLIPVEGWAQTDFTWGAVGGGYSSISESATQTLADIRTAR